ncbi:MAG: putative rane protein [Firmicutes bacterium]|nr:putative rane protein [Bacillota bacterium]
MEKDYSSVERWFNILLLLMVVFVLLPTVPFIYEVPAQDQGVFLYAGEHILKGQVPYRDFWDHKGPVIYFINAFGLFIGNHTLWGIWLIRVFLLFVFFRITHGLIKKTYGFVPSVLVIILGLMTTLIVFDDGGNFTEEYALVPQAISLYIITKPRIQKIDLFIIGCLASVCFLLRPNLIGIFIAIFIFSFYEGWKNKDPIALCGKVIPILAGFLTVLIPILMYFYLNDALQSLWEQVFFFNIAYSRGLEISIFSRIRAIAFGFIWVNALAVLSVWCWCSVLLSKRLDRNRLLIIATIAFPVEIILSSISGRVYSHYFTTWLISAMVLAAGLIEYLLNKTGVERVGKGILLGCFLLSLVSSIKYHEYFMSMEIIERKPMIEICKYIQSATLPEEYVVEWGPSATFNFLSKRSSPSKYFYQLPLYAEAYTTGVDTEKMLSEFFEDIKANPPALIIENINTDMGRIIPSISDDTEGKKNYRPIKTPQKIYEITAYIRSNYEQQQVLGYTIYTRKNIH